METWAWLLAYVGGFGLLQFVLYHHFRRDDATPGSAAGTGEASSQGAVDGPSGDDDLDGHGVYCQHCGALNEHVRTVRYCRECVGPLR